MTDSRKVEDAAMRAFGASDKACYLYPDDTPEHRAARAAYIQGAADATPSPLPVGVDDLISRLRVGPDASREISVHLMKYQALCNEAAAALASAPQSPVPAGMDWLRIATKKNWDGYRGEPTTGAAINTARSLCGIPLADGGVQIEMHVDGVDVEIDIGPDGKIRVEDSDFPVPAGTRDDGIEAAAKEIVLKFLDTDHNSPRIAQVRDTLSRALKSQPAPAGEHRIEHDGFVGTVQGSYVTREGKRGVVLQQVGTKVVHVYSEKRLKK